MARVSQATITLRSRLAARPHLLAVAIALLAGAITVGLALGADLPLRDPDGIAGPAFVRLPAIIAILLVLDVAPRAARRSGRIARLPAMLVEVARERWPRRRLVLVVWGLLSFYLTYVAYRNLKSFLPSLRPGIFDGELIDLDRLLFRVEPSELLHSVLGTGVAAYVLSTVYLFFLIFVPISLGAALVWTRDVARGFWYVTALGINWLLGALSYYVLPSLGPVFVEPSLFSDLPVTGASRLQQTLLDDRLAVLTDPHQAVVVQGIAGFASLHVAIVFTAALIAQLVGLPALVRWALWLFFTLTVLATIYLGWHYAIDDVAGVAIGATAVWLGAVATGHEVRPRLWRLMPAAAGSHAGTVGDGAA